MTRKQLEDSAWAKTPKDERRAQKERYDWKTQKTIVERLKGNAREVRVFDPSGSTEATMSPWMPLWSLYSDELEQRSKEEREPKLRPPYSRGRSDYTGDVESSPVTRRHSTVKSKPSKSPAQLQREIDEMLSQPTAFDAVYRQHQARLGAARSHSTIGAGTPWLKVGDVVQFRSEPGTGGVIRRFDADGGRWALVATARGERRVPIEGLARVRKEHEQRVRRSVKR